jgi:hypothetical protein
VIHPDYTRDMEERIAIDLAGSNWFLVLGGTRNNVG